MDQLFEAQSANGESTARDWSGGAGTLAGSGTFDSGTLTLQMSPDGGTTWLATSATLTAAGIAAFTLPPCKVRLSLGGASTPSVNGWIGKVTPTVR